MMYVAWPGGREPDQGRRRSQSGLAGLGQIVAGGERLASGACSSPQRPTAFRQSSAAPDADF